MGAVLIPLHCRNIYQEFASYHLDLVVAGTNLKQTLDMAQLVSSVNVFFHATGN